MHALPDAVVPEGQAETHASAPAALYLPESQAEQVSTVLAVPPIPRYVPAAQAKHVDPEAERYVPGPQ